MARNRRTQSADDGAGDFDAGLETEAVEQPAPVVESRQEPTAKPAVPATPEPKLDPAAVVTRMAAADAMNTFASQTAHARIIRLRTLARQYPEIRDLVRERDALLKRVPGNTA